MTHVFDLESSYARMGRIDAVIAAQGLYVLSTCRERQSQSKVNLQTLLVMRRKLGLAIELINAHNASSGAILPACHSP